MIETYIWGFLLRFIQSLVSAAPFILCGLLVTGVLRRLMGRELTVRLFGGNSRWSLMQAWVIGMLLPVCSLGVIPVVRELRKAGLKGGTILAFAMSAPLFNPLSVLYGLTLSEPLAIVTFTFCSLILVTTVGLLWDWMFPLSSQPEQAPPAVTYGIKRMLSICVVAAREAGGGTALLILAGLIGVALLGVVLPHGGLQHAMNGDNPLAPLTMSAIATPVYATPMLAMSQLGMMFAHANSPGAAFVLLVLGAGMNLGLAVWMWNQYGTKRTVGWFAILLAIVLILAYGVDRPLYPHEIVPADHTHAFDIYCRPFPGPTRNAGQIVLEKLKRDSLAHELLAASLLGGVTCFGLLINILDSRGRIEEWLEQRLAEQPVAKLDLIIPPPVLGGLALVGLVIVSVVGCYAYYPPPGEVLEEMNTARTEALSAVLAGDEVHAKYWIDRYQEWSRKLEVGVFLRDWSLSDYHRMKARVLRNQLELLKHEIEHDDEDSAAEIRHLVSQISRTHQRLRIAFMEER